MNPDLLKIAIKTIYDTLGGKTTLDIIVLQASDQQYTILVDRNGLVVIHANPMVPASAKKRVGDPELLLDQEVDVKT